MKHYRRAKEQRVFTRSLANEPQEQQPEGLGSGRVVSPHVSPEQALQRKIRDTNEGLKLINGHSAEYVAAQLHVSVEELFPPNGKTVYVGDPWQKLDRMGVVIVDYEFGPIAEFQDNRDAYLSVLQMRLKAIEQNLTLDHSPEVQQFLEQEVRQAKEFYHEAATQSVTEYEHISNEFVAMKQRIEAEIQRETSGTESDPLYAMDNDVRDLWYVAVHGARAVDVLDWATECDETYRTFAEKLSEHLPPQIREQKLKDKRQELIEAIRFEKIAKNAEVVQAMFPFLPFTDQSFDRFVAFWSISTYVLEHLEESELNRYWEEINRLLKPGGKAYISPLFDGNEQLLDQSLMQFTEQHPEFTYRYDNDFNPNTLIIERTGI